MFNIFCIHRNRSYLLYTANIPVSENAMIALFADDTAVVTHNGNYESAIAFRQSIVHHIASWTNHWKISLNEIKSVRIYFSLWKK